MVKLIATDLDGTLLQNKAQSLSSSTLDLISKLRKKGILFVAASGRQHGCMYRMFEHLRDDIIYISNNGALCLYNGATLVKEFLPRELGLRVLKSLSQMPHCGCVLSAPKTDYVENSNPALFAHMRDVVKYDVLSVNSFEDISEPFLKIAIHDSRGIRQSEEFFHKNFGSQAKVVTSGNQWMDIMKQGVNKGSTLEILLKHLHISPADCVSFGDQYNDVEMLQLTGTSYAMNNAAPGISHHATETVATVEEVLEDILAQS